MTWVVWLLVGTAVMIGLVAAAVYAMTIKAQTPRLLSNGSVPEMPYEKVEWMSGGQPIKGWFVPQLSPSGEHVSAPIIVIAHGWGSNRSRVLRYAGPLHEAGYTLVMYDARSHGESGAWRTPSGLQFRDDLIAAVGWVKSQPELAAERLGVLGHSLGAFGAVLALDEGLPIDALATDAMPVQFATMIAAELKRKGIPAFPLAKVLARTVLWRSRIPAAMMTRLDPALILQRKAGQLPVLLVHSRRDDFIPVSELQYVVDRVPGVPHLLVDAEGHSCSEQDSAFWPAVLNFFGKHLKDLSR